MSRDGTKLRPPVGYGYFKNIDAHEMRALIAYLRSLAPVPMAISKD